MSFNRLIALTYNGVTIGQGSAYGEPDGGWSLSITPETGIVKMRFIVGAQGGPNAISNMIAIENAFSVRRKSLTIVYNSVTAINSFLPAFNSLTGYEAFPEIRHSPEIDGPHSIGAETYEITVRFRIPADNNGRRDEHPAINKSLSARRSVRFTGVWTAVLGSQGAREQWEDGSVGFEPHATTFLNAYDNSVSWLETIHNVVVNDTDTEVSYDVEFREAVHGQLHEERTIHQDLHGLRRLLVSGIWADPAGVQSGSAYAALAAFNDVTNGFQAQINTWIAANFTGKFFALYALNPTVNVINGTVNYSAELWETEADGATNTGRRFARVFADALPSGRLRLVVSGVYMQTVVANVTKSALANANDVTDGYLAFGASIQSTYYGALTFDGFVTNRLHYNEQVGIVEFELECKQILLKQSAAALRDTDVLDDQWDLFSNVEGPGDTPVTLNGLPITNATTTSVQRPIRLTANYRAWINKTVDPMTKWTSTLQGYVVQVVNSTLKPAATPGAIPKITVEIDPANNILTAHIELTAFAAPYLALSIEEAVSRDNGFIFSPRLSGVPDDFTEQQGPTIGTKVRTTHLASLQSGAINNFQSGNSIAGYRRLRFRTGQTAVIVGVAPNQVAIYVSELVEEFLAVGNALGGGTQERVSDNANPAAAQGADGQGQTPANPANPSGKPGAGGKAAAKNQGAHGGGAVPSQGINANFNTFGIGGSLVGSVFGGSGGGGIPSQGVNVNFSDFGIGGSLEGTVLQT